MKESPTLATSAKVKKLNAEGKGVINFAAGEPDFDTPDFAKEAAIKAIRDGHNGYTPASGTPAIKKAVIDWVKKDLALDYKPGEVIVSLGAKHSLYNISQVLYEEGDEVIIFAPYWVTYPDQVMLAGATPVIVDCRAEDGFNPDIKELESKITDKTKALILNSPGNPSGAVYSDDTVKAIAELAVKRDFIIVSDECYDKIVYEGKPLSPATLGDDVKSRTLLVNAWSKTYSMTGWRLGYTLGPAEIVKAMSNIQSQSTSNPVTPMQFGGARALGDLDFLAERVAEFKKRRDVMVAALNGLDGVSCIMPKGAFYAFPDFGGWIGKTYKGEKINDDAQLTNMLIDHAR
ncbi:MAG: pyridoxal phosphate-dependent aminotransferase, partial [Nitrospinota bacterium]